MEKLRRLRRLTDDRSKNQCAPDLSGVRWPEERRFEAEFGPVTEPVDTVADYFRAYAGQNASLLALDEERSRLETLVDMAKEEVESCLRAVEAYEGRETKDKLTDDDIEFGVGGDMFFLDKAYKRLKKLTKRLYNINLSIDDRLADKEDDPDQEDGDNVRAWYYLGMHELCKIRLRALEKYLRRSKEFTDKRVLKRIDRLLDRKEVNGPWYYTLYVLVISKYISASEAEWFGFLSPEDKKIERRNPDNFWVAAYDRLRNFRRVNEKTAQKNNRVWRLPTNDCSLNVQFVPYSEVESDTEVPWTLWDYCRGQERSEDAIIAMIDEKNRKE